MLPKPSPEGGGGGEIELRPSAREAQPPGGTRLNLSEHHARAPARRGPRWFEGGIPSGSDRAGISPNPNPSYTGTSYGHVPGVGLFLGACTALGGKPSQIFP